MVIDDVEIIDPINYMQENLLKKINQNQNMMSVAVSSPAPQSLPLPPNSWQHGPRQSEHFMGSPPSKLVSQHPTIPVINIQENAVNVQDKVQIENEVVEAKNELNKIKSDLDELKNKKIKEMEELLELKKIGRAHV